MHSLKDYIKCGGEFDEKLFKSPPAALYPTYSWLWTGHITRDGIKERLDKMKDAGILSFYVLPLPEDFSPGGMATTLYPEYLSDEFFDLVRFAADYAKEKGMAMWIYDEGGWPSGNACEKVVKTAPQHCAKKLVKTENGYELQTRYYPYTLTKKPHYADSASSEANDIFIDLTYEGYKNHLKEYFGDFLPVIFTDEPAIRFPALPNGAAELYKERYGEDIESVFPALFDEQTGRDAEQKRIQYCTIVSEIFRNNYFKKLQSWCKEKGILFAGHLNMDNTLQGSYMNHYGSQLETLRCFDIPAIDVIWRQIYPFSENRVTSAEYDGVTDYPFFPRLASSAANQNGTNLAASESLAVYRHGITADIIRYVSNYQYIRGINIMNFMTVPYESSGNIPFTMAPLFSPDIRPDYDSLLQINQYIARMSYLTTLGKRDTDTALVMPLDDIYAGGEREKKALADFAEKGAFLERHQVDFDIIDSASLKQAVIRGGKLCIGSAEYKSVIYPNGKKLSDIPNDLLPVIECDCEHIRAMRRSVGEKKIYFIFNEKNAPVTVNITIPDLKSPVMLDCISGKSYSADLSRLTLEMGQMVIITEGDAPALPRYDRVIKLEGFDKKPISKLYLDGSGAEIKKAESFDGGFSGSISFEGGFTLDAIPKNAAISFEKLCYSAEITVNGYFAGYVTLTPYKISLSPEALKVGENKIEIKVSNTPANAYTDFDPLEFFDKRFTGGYNQKQRLFEKDSMAEPSFEGAAILLESEE